MKTTSLTRTAVAIGIAIACASLTAASREAAAAEAKKGPPPAPPVSVSAALEREVREWDEFSGRLEATETVEVRARVSGMLAAVHFQAGADVKQGDPLFSIDPRPFQADVARAEAELTRATARIDAAKTELVRAQKLFGSKAATQQEVDERTAAVRENEAAAGAARAALDAARLQLEFTKIVAPIAGRLGRAEVTPGNWVNGGSVGATLLATIVTIDPVHAWFEVDEQVFLRYQAFGGTRAGARPPIHLGLANESGFPREGRIDFIDNRLDPKTGTVRVRAVFANRDRRLTPGLFARLRVAGGGAYRAVLVTDRAIGTDQNRKFVLVVGPDNMLQYRAVTLGASIDGLRVIREGLKGGETIVVNGLQRVRPGMPVTPQPVPMEANGSAAGDAASKPGAAR